ncbi:MAG: PQQ-dependent sugar dehydrogenase, partial [Gammaproteobacteria bacterium]
MKKFFLSFARFLIIGVILWAAVSQWLGINAPLLRKSTPEPEILSQRIQLPDGFSIAVYANGLPGVRMLRLTDTGDLLASQPKKGRILLLESDSNRDGRPDEVRDLVVDLDMPHGFDFYRGWLYIAETGAIGRI